MSIQTFIDAHERRRTSTLNMVASENVLSPSARQALSSDFSHRYIIPPSDRRPSEIWDYPNQRYTRELEQETLELAGKLFHGACADVRPLSGNNAALITLTSLVPARGTVLSIGGDCGGHFATSAICKRHDLQNLHIPYHRTTMDIDFQSLRTLCREFRADLVFLDASMTLFPYPLAELRNLLGSQTPIIYDASHTLGLIAGGRFQNPLEEGADVLQGSTHKSFFGPQKGLYVMKQHGKIAQTLQEAITPLHVSNLHAHHVAALGIALEEMRDFGRAYASQVIANSQSLGNLLLGQGLRVLHRDGCCTESHQVIVRIGSKPAAISAFERLESIGIHVNAIRVPFTHEFGLRIGTAELTRRGMNESAINTVGTFIYGALLEKRSQNELRESVRLFSETFPDIHYCQQLEKQASIRLIANDF